MTKALFAALLAASSFGAWAGLGGPPADLGPPASTASAHRAAGLASYTQLERKLESGILVREYLDSGGTVFAVSWSGPFLPDLKEILGPHFNALVTARRSGASRSRLVVQQDDLVIVSGGHMGAFEGKAWLPARLPAGFGPGDVK